MKGRNTKTVAVAMSGGVDSSTVAAMLCERGYKIIGLTMQLWNQRRLSGRDGIPETVQGRCCSIDDVYDARHVAETLDIPYYVVNQESRFEQDVVRPFVEDYLSGRTPIPCSLCNNHLKFDQLLITARQIGADLLATGHYARNEYDERTGRWLLKRPADLAKDQTYFLFGLTQEQLSRTLFPLGEMRKPEVREEAKRTGLRLFEKPDSQEICFIPGGDYKKFLDAYLDEQGEEIPDTSGELVTTTGEVVGNAQRHPQLYRRPAQGPRCRNRIAAVRPGNSRRQASGRGRSWRSLALAYLTRQEDELDRHRRSSRADSRARQDSASSRCRARDCREARR